MKRGELEIFGMEKICFWGGIKKSFTKEVLMSTFFIFRKDFTTLHLLIKLLEVQHFLYKQ